MITQKELKVLVDYNPTTGVLSWLPRPCKDNLRVAAWNARFAGKPVGSLQRDCKTSYLVTRISGVGYKVHRLIWLYVYGNFPLHQIDHLDRNGINNRLDNLRDVCQSTNKRNSNPQLNNKSGTVGVAWNKAAGKWEASLRNKGKKVHLGLFCSLTEAATARRAASETCGYHPHHGEYIR